MLDERTIASEIYLYRRSRKIGKDQPVQRDITMARTFIEQGWDKDHLFKWLGEHARSL